MTVQSRSFLSATSIRVDVDVPKSINKLEDKIIEHNIKFAGNSDKQIKAAPRAMAEKLVRLYKHAFHTWQMERMGLVEGLEPMLLEMNNQLLAKIMSTTDRTIRNYKKRLTELGFILKSIYHGSKQPFELLINPEFLVFRKRHKDGIWIYNVQIFPPKGSSTSSQNFTSTLLAEDSAKDDELGPAQRKKAPEQQENEGNPAPMNQVPEQQPEQFSQNEKGSTQTDSINQKAAQLFAKARPLLWPGQYFSQNEVQSARKNIARIFERRPDRVQCLHDIALYRCLLASAYWKREFDEEIQPTGQFFDPDNPKGIAATKDWMFDQERFPLPKINRADKFKLQTKHTNRKNDVNSIGSLFNRE